MRKTTMGTALAVAALGAGAALPAQAALTERADDESPLCSILGLVGLGGLLGCDAPGPGPGPDPDPPAASDRFRVTTERDTVDASPGDRRCADAAGDCSLRAAVQEANALGGTRTISLQENRTYGLSIAGRGEDAAARGDLDVTADVTLDGNAATVNAREIDRAFDVLAGARLDARRLVVTNGSAVDENGGALRSVSRLELANVDVRGSAATGTVAPGTAASGGAVFNGGGMLVVRNGTISGNTAPRAGGGIEANAGTTKLQRVTLRGNETGPTPGNGGGLHLTGQGTVEVSRSDVNGNTAGAEGGGLWNSATGTMTVEDTRLVDNTAAGAAADQGGGGLFNDGGTLSVDRAVVQGNDATGASGSGGGILNDGGTLRVDDSRLQANKAQRAGGGIEADAGETRLRNVTLRANTTGPAPGNGGGLHLTGDGTVTVSGSTVSANVAANEGGGLWNSAAGEMTVRDTRLSGNKASGTAADAGGGALFNDGGTLTVSDSVLQGNAADTGAGSGGGILNDGGTLRVRDTRLQDNTARRAGGGIEADVGTTRLDRVTLVGNRTGPMPGNGGGLHLTGAGMVRIVDSQVRRNQADNEGGGLWNSATGTMTVTGTAIAGNVAPVGPDVFNDGGTFTIDGTPVPSGP